MNHEPDDRLTGLLATAVEQLLATPGADVPPSDLDAAVLGELSRKAGSPHRSATRGRTGRLAKYAVAASILFVAASVAWLGWTGDGSVYAAFTQRMQALTSVIYWDHWVDEADLVNVVPGDGRKVTYLAPCYYRIEQPGGDVVIVDTKAQKAIRLLPASREAMVMSGPASLLMPFAEGAVGSLQMVDAIQKHFQPGRKPPAGVEALGEKKIATIEAVGFRSTIAGETMEAWIDPATGLPVEIRIRQTIPIRPLDATNPTVRMWRILSGFQYDPKIDAALMSVDAPAGYNAVEMPEVALNGGAAPPSLADLADLLAWCARHNDSTFPVSLSLDGTPGTCLAIMKQSWSTEEKLVQSGSDAEKQAVMKQAVEVGATMGRATAFLVALRPENKARYAGRGVKLDAENQPIFWFSPKGDTHFQVVYADLSIREVAESELPELPAEEPRKPDGPRVIRTTSPRVVLPQSAIKSYDALQRVRQQGKQADVRFLDLKYLSPFTRTVSVPDGPLEVPRPVEVEDDNKTDIDPAGVRLGFLAEFPNLEGLTLGNATLTEGDLAAIGGCRKLERLSLDGVEIVRSDRHWSRLQGSDLAHLSQLANLEMLDLSQSNFSGGLKHLAGLPKLHALILSSFENLNDASVAELKELPHLRTLVLAAVYETNPETTVTDAGLKSLRQLPSLKTLYVGWHGEFTLPIKKLRALLPGVDVRPGFQEIDPALP